MNAVFAWTNAVSYSILTVSNAAAGLNASQLQNDQGSSATAWQTTAGTTSAALLIDTTNPGQQWGAFAVARTNLTANAIIRWVVIDAFTSGHIGAGIARGFGQSVYVLPTPVYGSRVQLDISDPTNPDGFLNIPFVFAGPCFVPKTNIAWESSFGRDDLVDEVTTRGGQEYPAYRWARRRWDVSLQGVRAAEVWPSVMEMDRVARRGGNLLFVPNPTSQDVQRETIFGRGRPLSDLTFPAGNGDRRAYKIRITERL